jgi:predicted HNH restriction endonuclease
MPYKDTLKNKECKRQWYLNNRDRILREARDSYCNNAALKREKSKKYREKNPLKSKDRYERKKLEDIEQVLKRRDRNKEEAILSKGGKCEMCGFEYNGENAACFDFHHTDPNEKRYNPSTALRLSKERRDEELSKCLLVCANCHRLIHAKRNDK